MTFGEIVKINVNEHTEKKGNLTYLSWSWTWQEFKKIFPTATYEIVENPLREDGLRIFGNSEMGYEVRTKVTADGLTYEMWLPVMDFRNRSTLTPTTMDINKATMRCLVKDIAMFGLGLYIYAGEDLPEGEIEEPPTDNFLASPTEQALSTIITCDGNEVKLVKVYNGKKMSVEDKIDFLTKAKESNIDKAAQIDMVINMLKGE